MADFVIFFAPAVSVFWLAAVRLLLEDFLSTIRLCVLLWINYSLALFRNFLNQRSDLGFVIVKLFERIKHYIDLYSASVLFS